MQRGQEGCYRLILRFFMWAVKSGRSLTSSDANPPFVLAVELATVLKRVHSKLVTHYHGSNFPSVSGKRHHFNKSACKWKDRGFTSTCAHTHTTHTNIQRHAPHHTHARTHTPSLISRQHVNNEPTWQQGCTHPTCAHTRTHTHTHTHFKRVTIWTRARLGSARIGTARHGSNITVFILKTTQEASGAHHISLRR